MAREHGAAEAAALGLGVQFDPPGRAFDAAFEPGR